MAAIYELSFWAHYELVTIHPWVDGNGRTCRLLMNLLQMEYGVLPTKVLRKDKAEYIQALVDTREEEDVNIFIDCMTKLHCTHVQEDIDKFIKSVSSEQVDKQDFLTDLVDKWSINGDLADKMADILVFVADKKNFTSEMIVNKLGFSQTTTKRYLRRLVEMGYIAAHGGNRNRTYSITI